MRITVRGRSREGQKRDEWTAGFGIVAKFPELFNKKTD